VKRISIVAVAALAGVIAFATACNRLSSPEKKAGYAVGLSIGQSLKSISSKVDTSQVIKGLEDQLAGKSGMQDQEMQGLLMGLSQGGSGDQGKTGYAVGMSIGKNVGNLKGLIDDPSLSSGILDQLAGKPKMDDAKMREALNELTTRQQASQKEKNAASSAKNKAEGAAYLEKNKAKAGVKVTASGLQYEVVKMGSGPKPKATNTVRVHYTGTLLDGTKFDSSVDRGQPAEFPLNGVIKGWTEGLQLMPVGSKFKFTIPSELAYGSNGAGAQIGPDSVLIFDVELLKIVK
jgi:FKBP-type peptidyl-prolyl cis-trans isomerase